MAQGVQSIRRRAEDGNIYFLNNRTDKTVSEFVHLTTSAEAVALFSPMSGKHGFVEFKKESDGNIQVPIQLQSFESIIVRTYCTKKTISFSAAQGSDEIEIAEIGLLNS